MFVVVDENDGRPIYRQVADGIRALIAKGELKEGAQLPPVRQLASDLGVNLNTIATAYRELQAEGLINVRHGSGAVVERGAARHAAAVAIASVNRCLQRRCIQSLSITFGAEVADVVSASAGVRLG